MRFGLLPLLLVGTVGLFTILSRVRATRGARVSAARFPIRDRAVYLGFGARPEEEIFSAFAARSELETVRAQQDMLVPPDDAGWPTWAELLAQFRSALREVLRALQQCPPELHGYRLDVWTHAATQVGVYAYARAWWAAVRRRSRVKTACVLAGDTYAFAAVAEGLPTVFVQHGLLERDLLFPRFAEIRALTRFERRHLEHAVPTAKVTGRDPAAREDIHQPVLLVVSGNRPSEEMKLALPLIRFLAARSIPTRVRLFRNEAPGRFWAPYVEQGLVQFADSKVAFDTLCEELRPMFVASWGSTALIDALYKGTLPICVAASDDRLLEEMIFPLRRCCLCWPLHEEWISRVADDPDEYAEAVRALWAAELAAEPCAS